MSESTATTARKASAVSTRGPCECDTIERSQPARRATFGWKTTLDALIGQLLTP